MGTSPNVANPAPAQESESFWSKVGKSIGWSNGYPAPPGVIVPPYGTQGAPEVAKTAVVITAWILVIGTDGAAAPVLRPVLIPF